MNVRHCFIPAAIFALTATCPAIASDHRLTSDTLEEILVTGRLEESIPLKLSAYGNRVEVVTAEDIQLGGFNDIAQTLQMRVPGLFIAPKNGAFDYVGCSLQGSRCQDILWLVDGVRISNRLYNSTSPLDTVPAHMVERVEVLYGGQGIFYGTQSVAGVVNIVTRAFDRETGGSVSAGFDENGGRHYNAQAHGSLGIHEFVVYAADGFQPYRDADYQPSATDRERSYDVVTVGLKYALPLASRGRLSLHYHHGENRADFAAPTSRDLAYNDRDEDLLTAKLDWAFSEQVSMFVKGYYHSWDTDFYRRDNVLDDDGNLTGDTTIVSDNAYWGYEDYGLNAVLDLRSDHGLDYSLGYEQQRYSGRDDVLLIRDQEERVDAVFAQVRTSASLLDNTSVAFGARYNRPSGEGDVTVWNLSAKHNLSPGFYLRGTLGTAFRFPDAWQLYGNDPCCTLGNPDLEGERSENINLAVGGQTDAGATLSWEVTGFHRRVDNLIGSANGQRVNSDERVDVDGADLSLRLHLGERWLLSTSYTHSEAEDSSNRQVAGIPTSLAKLGLDFASDTLPVEFNISAAWTGDVYTDLPGDIGRREHGNYTVVDVGLLWHLDQRRHHQLGLRLENALDEDYASSMGRAFTDREGEAYPYSNLGTPRTIHANYRFTF